MLIRSQDRKNLINSDNIFCINIQNLRALKPEYNFVISADGVHIGEYSTEEKAIEVLDMIQERYLSRMKLDGGFDMVSGCYIQPNFWVLPTVFQMPQDSEV